jgi:hypothetical protein
MRGLENSRFMGGSVTTTVFKLLLGIQHSKHLNVSRAWCMQCASERYLIFFLDSCWGQLKDYVWNLENERTSNLTAFIGDVMLPCGIKCIACNLIITIFTVFFVFLIFLLGFPKFIQENYGKSTESRWLPFSLCPVHYTSKHSML